MDDDGIAEITATLRFDRAILLFWCLSDNQILTIFNKNSFIKSLTCKDFFSIFVKITSILKKFLFYGSL
jgi:hypothetical protein